MLRDAMTETKAGESEDSLYYDPAMLAHEHARWAKYGGPTSLLSWLEILTP